jgi:hypothetical protein
MKKIFVTAIVFVTLFASIGIASAQTVDSQVLVNSLLEQYLQLLIKEVGLLEQQLAVLQANQATSVSTSTPALSTGEIGTATSTENISSSTASSTSSFTPSENLQQLQSLPPVIQNSTQQGSNQNQIGGFAGQSNVPEPIQRTVNVSQNTSFASGTYSAGTRYAEIASFLVDASSTDGLSTCLRINTNKIQNIRTSQGGPSVSTVGTVGQTFVFPGVSTLPGEVDVYADLQSSFGLTPTGTYSSLIDYVGCSVSNVSWNPSQVIGQSVTIQ